MRWWEKSLVVAANLVVLINYALWRFTEAACQWRTADLGVLVALINFLMLFEVISHSSARGKTGK